MTLLDEIRGRPDDDEPRRVYADALLAAGDPHGELIAVQLVKDPTPELRERERALLEAHALAWCGPLGAPDLERKIAGGIVELDAHGKRSARFRRGFLEEVILHHVPRGFVREALAGLAASPYACVGSLHVESCGLTADDVRALAAWSDRLTTFELVDEQDPDAIAALAEAPDLASVRSLLLNEVVLDAAGVARLAASPHLANVVRLNLSYNKLGPAGARALGPWIRGLETLALDSDAIGSDGIEALLALGPANLKVLELRSNRIDDRGALALARWPGVTQLERLELEDNPIGWEGGEALEAAGRLGRDWGWDPPRRIRREVE